MSRVVFINLYIHIQIYPDILWIMRISGYYSDIRWIIRISKILYPSNSDIRISVGYPFLTDNGYKLYFVIILKNNVNLFLLFLLKHIIHINNIVKFNNF